MKFFQKNKKENRKGFTLVETLIAISILLVGVSAAFSAAQSGLSSTIAVKDRITAIFLAQEAMEAVRNLKDSNLLLQNKTLDNNSPYWLDGLAGPGNPCAGGNPCDYDFDSINNFPEFINCGSSCFLNINNAGEYVHEAGSPQSRFRRFITITEISSGPIKKEALVVATVTWSGQTVVVRDNLFNWFAPVSE